MKNNTALIAMTYVGAVIGAGFASGQELWQYFAIFGRQGLVSLSLAGIAFAFLGQKILNLAKTKGWQNQNQLLTGIFSPPLAKLMNFVLFCFLLTILGVMLAAVGTLLQQKLGLPKLVGIMGLWLFLWFALKGGEAKILRLQSLLVPPLLLMVLVVCLITICHNPLKIQAMPIQTLPLALNWGVLYVGYNMLGAFPALVAFSHSNKGSAGIVGGLILGVLAIFGVLALASFSPNGSPMPLLDLAAQISPKLGQLYSLTMIIAILTTALTTAFALVNPFQKKGRIKAKTLILLLALPIALVDFTVLVARVYSLFGILGAFLMAAIVMLKPKT